jgi:CheY-like chemotaxis protein
MNGVMGMLQLMTMTTLDDEQFEYVETAMASGESLLTIINDILDYSKIEAGKLQMTPEEFQIRELVKPLITSFRTAINHEKVKLLCSISPEVPAILVADHVRIRQILYNLVGNAVKFTEKGEIHIGIRILESIGDARVKIECTIADTGIGVPEDIGNKLFEPFTQIESSKQKKIKGTGLGLSIVKQLVRQMEGTVHLCRNKTHGTTVTFTLVVGIGKTQSEPERSSISTPILTSPNRRLSTLVVEDEQINQQILQAILTKLGHRSTIASDGYLALELLKTHRFDIVLMDVQMPELDGIEATRIIRTSENYSHVQNIPIIALTAYAMAGDKDKCLEAGMDSYLAKPVDIKALEKQLKTLTAYS